MSFYVRPVGRFHYRYCYRVDRVFERDGYLSFEAVRFGLDDRGLPVKDGHQDRRWPGFLSQVRRGVFRFNDVFSNGWGGPLYFREIAVPGQLELFQ